MKFFTAVALLASASAIKLARRDPTIQDAANSFGDTRTAGKLIESHQELTYRNTDGAHNLTPPTVPMKIQRDPPFLFTGPHPNYHSNSSTGNAGQAGEFANGGTLTRANIGS